MLHGEPIDARSELLLYLAARATFVAECVRPALESGRVVISDRYELSTMAYQGYGRQLPLEQVRAANAFATGGLRADLTMVLRVPEIVSMGRQAERGARDRIEREDREFHRRVAAAYEELTRSEPGVEALDGTLPPDQLHAAVVRLLQERFPETFARGQG